MNTEHFKSKPPYPNAFPLGALVFRQGCPAPLLLSSGVEIPAKWIIHYKTNK
jgi:hypothetical protein